MDNETAFPAWIIFLLIALGVALAVGIALLLTQLDALQQRTLLPQATLAVIDLEATVAAGELTVVVIAGEDSQSGTPTMTSTPIPQTPEQETIEPTAAAVLVPTCAAAPDDWTPYVVQEGDTLTSLSILRGVAVDMLLQANCLGQSQLIPGQIILLPSLTPTAAAAEQCGVPPDWVHYIVKPDDTLASLAKKHHTTVTKIMQANCLEDTQIAAGRKLFLPPMPVQKPMQPPVMVVPPGRHTGDPGWHPGMRPTATFPVWPTRMVTNTPTKIPWPEDTPTPAPSSTFTNTPIATEPATAAPALTATPLSSNTPEAPLPSATSEPPAPTMTTATPLATTAATLTPPAYPYP